jgi:hypothetical protein
VNFSTVGLLDSGIIWVNPGLSSFSLHIGHTIQQFKRYVTHRTCPTRSFVRQDLGCVMKLVLIIIWGEGESRRGYVSQVENKELLPRTWLIGAFVIMLPYAHRAIGCNTVELL